MGYSPTSVAVPLLYTASSTMISLAWRVVTSSTSSIISRRSSSTSLSRPSKSPESDHSPVKYHPTPPSTTSQMELRLSTCCTSCGNKVSLEVPKWISDSVDIAQNYQQCDGTICQGERRGAGGGSTAGEIRKLVVEGTVGFAQAVKASPILPILFAAVKAFVAFMVYLDARFLLRQQAAAAATEIATGFVEIEKELGLMRNAGEGLSIGWEALVKGIIALAKSDSTPPSQATQYDYPASCSNKVYPFTRLDSFDQSSMYQDEPVSPTYSSSHRHPSYLSTDTDESGAPTLTPPSPTGTPHLSAPTYVPPLRRTPLSSPILRTHYLASTPSQEYFHEARLAAPSSSYRPPSYATEDSFDLDSAAAHSVLHRRSRSGPDVSPSSSSQQSTSETGGSWPTRTMLGWADRLLTRADSFNHGHR